jgi:hypothetical protein
MRSCITAVALLTSALAPVAFAAETAPPAASTVQALTCDAPFTKDTTEETLIARFGKGNVTYRAVPGTEGMETNATVIFPNEPTKMLTIYWQDEDKRARPDAISVRADFSADPEGMDPWISEIAWQSAEGLKIGSSVAEVEKANGKPFKISGFKWDYGGYAIGWEGGALDSAQRNGCNLVMRFSPTGTETPPGALGDVELMSNSAEIAAAKPRVTELTISYPSE